MHGQFVWYELMTTDAAGAQRFYPAITGWGTQKWDAPNSDYTMWTSGGVPFGGMVQLTTAQRAQGIPPNWLLYIAVDSVDAAASKATSLGGKVMMAPQDIPGTGRFAVIQDPQGATLAIYKSNNPGLGFDGTPTLGHFSWHELMTTDYKSAFGFYSSLFGWVKTSEFDMGGGNMYFMFGMQGKRFGAIYNRPKEAGNDPPNWLCYVNVRDAKSAVDAITRGGGKLVHGPQEVPGGDWIAQAADPQGTMFAVHQTAARSAVAPAAKPAAKKAKAKARAKPKAMAKKKAQAKPKKKSKAKRKSGRR